MTELPLHTMRPSFRSPASRSLSSASSRTKLSSWSYLPRRNRPASE
jgi:hypothetical protein